MLSGAHCSHSAGIMNRLRALGTSPAVDDFGISYSSLSYLPFLPFDALKIDRSFVLNMNSRAESESMVRTLVALARNIGMRVIVAGVETSGQLELIRAFGAEEVQGFLFGRTAPNTIDVFFIPAEDGVKTMDFDL